MMQIGYIQDIEMRGSMLNGKELVVKSSLEGETFVQLKQAAQSFNNLASEKSPSFAIELNVPGSAV